MTPLVPGSRIARYEIVEVIERDARFAVRDDELGREVHVELLAPDRRAIVHTLARLSHPNLVAVHDVGAHGDQLYVATERLPGTLHTWLEQPRTWSEVLARFVEAARGLQALHAGGLAYLHVNLDRLGLDAAGHVRIDRLTDARPLDERPDGALVDQQALCITLEAALGGIRRGATPAAVRRAIARGRAEEPADRWGSMDALIAALTPRSRRPWLIAAVPLIAGAAAGAVWLDARREASEPVAEAPATPGAWMPALLARMPVGTMSISRDGKRLAGGADRSLWIQARGDSRQQPLPVPADGEIIKVRFAPDGRAVLVVTQRARDWGVWRVLLTQPPRLEHLTSVNQPPFVDVSPDGGKLLISNDDAASAAALGLREIDLATGNPRTLIAATDDPIRLAVWSPDGRRIACHRSSELRVDLLLVDAATAAVHSLRTYRVLSERLAETAWRSPDTLLLNVELFNRNSSRSVIQEVQLRDGVLGESRELYGSPEYTAIHGLERTAGEVFFAQTSWARRVLLLDLREPIAARRPRFLDVGGRSVGLLTGWTASGNLVLAADLAGNWDPIQIDLTGKVEVLATTWWDDEPTLVLADDIWLPVYAAAGAEPVPSCTLTRRHRGRSEALGVAKCVSVVCAGDHQPPCLSIRAVGGDPGGFTLHEWDPDTGRQSQAAVYRGTRDRDDRMIALSVDGKQLAVPQAAGSVEVVDLVSGRSRRVGQTASTAGYRFVTWTDQGAIIATRVGARHELVRIDPDGSVTELFSSSSLWLARPLLSPDGHTLAATAADLETTYWTAPLIE